MATRLMKVRWTRRLALAASGLATTALLWAPSAAEAEQSGYESVGVPGSPGGSSDGTLPFTGFDLVSAAIVALAMLLIGIGLWRLGREGHGAEDAS